MLLPRFHKNHILKLCLGIIAGGTFLLASSSNAYMIGLKSRDNSIGNIQWVEKTVNTRLPIVSFIFHTRESEDYKTIADLPYTLGRDRIYHITLSPERMTAKQVADGAADKIYKGFFELIKSMHIKVVFRTMHEMNGGRYPRGSYPEDFKKAWIHVRNISREAGLTKEDILFDMSVNGWDLPTTDTIPSQTSPLIHCYPSQKTKLNCPTFEDYYPGDEYVDILGFTFYNRGKGNTNRLRQTPYEIIDHPSRRTLTRLKKFNKPLFLDEVGTTAVWYDGAYSQAKSQEVFAQDTTRKDIWLDSLSSFLLKEPEIVGAVYFNVDLTYGLRDRLIGEADWAIFDPYTQKIYEGGKRLLENASYNKAKYAPLYSLFGVYLEKWGDKQIFIGGKYGKKAIQLLTALSINHKTPYSEATKILDTYEKSIKDSSKMTKLQKTTATNILNEARNIIVQ